MSDSPLGLKQGEFRIEGQIGRGCLGVICSVGGVAILVGIVVNLVNGTLIGGGRLLLAAGLCLMGGFALLRSVGRAGRTRVEVFTDGLVLHEGPAIQSCRWQDVVMVIQKEAVDMNEGLGGALISEFRAFHLHLRSGQVIVLKSYIRRLLSLGSIVKRETLPHLLTGYQADLAEGRTATFGPLAIDRDGIVAQEQKLPWSEVRQVRQKAGWIKLYRPGKWFAWKKLKLSEIPNAHVLLHLASEFTGAGTAQDAG
jgi:hypothetical protein